MNCLNCGKYTQNPKFCCRSCAVSFNNKLKPKKKYYCRKCGKFLFEGYQNRRITLCDECNPRKVNWSTITYGEMTEKQNYQINSHIRDLARRVYAKSTKPKCCANCGYSKHYEICHIKPIEEHSKDTPVSVINDITNLIALCPNCHWELDHGELECKPEWK